MALARVKGSGHPDRACDLVAATICEEYLRRDPASCLNVHVTGGRGALFVVGDVHSNADFDVSLIVQQALGAAGVTSSIEPFIAFEPMSPTWAVKAGARETTSVVGYATDATPECVPLIVAKAREIAREIECRRVSDPEWFWLGSDYEVSVEDGRGRLLITVRVQHVESPEPFELREKIKSLLEPHLNGAELRINMAGEETLDGLASRMGASSQTSSEECYGTALPSTASGVGKHLVHPLNLGAWLARQISIELVEMKKGKAVMTQATWLPLESKPHEIRIRNERGEDLSSLIDVSRFDLQKAPAEFLSPELLIAILCHFVDSNAIIPWEPR